MLKLIGKLLAYWAGFFIVLTSLTVLLSGSVVFDYRFIGHAFLAAIGWMLAEHFVRWRRRRQR